MKRLCCDETIKVWIFVGISVSAIWTSAVKESAVYNLFKSWILNQKNIVDLHDQRCVGQHLQPAAL